jgi:hypothetical protein
VTSRSIESCSKNSNFVVKPATFAEIPFGNFWSRELTQHRRNTYG